MKCKTCSAIFDPRKKTAKFCSKPCYWKSLEKPNTSEERFWAFVEKTKSCWIWTGAKKSREYGSFWVSDEQRTMGAHRFSYILHYGAIPDKKVIRHNCDNPACVNPKHLICGTQQENLNDMAKRKRRNLKLSDIAIKHIRQNSNKLTKTYLANKFNVHRSTITDVINFKIYKFV